MLICCYKRAEFADHTSLLRVTLHRCHVVPHVSWHFVIQENPDHGKLLNGSVSLLGSPHSSSETGHSRCYTQPSIQNTNCYHPCRTIITASLGLCPIEEKTDSKHWANAQASCIAIHEAAVTCLPETSTQALHTKTNSLLNHHMYLGCVLVKSRGIN